MVSVYDVDATALIEKLAGKLAKEIKMPEWANFVKTGSHKERPPVLENWWYIRAAAILRTIYKNGPVGVSKLRSKYGGAKNRGRKRHKFTKGSGKVIRIIVQQLEEKGYLKRAPKGKGRLTTSQGQSLLEKTASEVYTKYVKPAAPKVVAKPVKVAPKPTEKTASAPSEKPKDEKVVKAAPKKEAKPVKRVAKPAKAPAKKASKPSKTASKASGKKK